MTSRAVIASVVSLGALGAATGVAYAAPPPSAAHVPVARAQTLIAPVHYRCWVRLRLDQPLPPPLLVVSGTSISFPSP